MKKRSAGKTPPVSPPDYGRGLRGLGFNLLVKDVARSVRFATEVLGLHLESKDEERLLLRMDDKAYRIVVERGPADDLIRRPR